MPCRDTPSTLQHAAAAAGMVCALLPLAAACAPAPELVDATADAATPDAGPAARAGIALYDGLGVWPEGLAALRGAIVDGQHDLRVISAADLRAGALDGKAALVIGGGWAWDQWQGLGEDGITAIRRFVHGGGGYLGICAGAYLASDDVVWDDAWIAYPLNILNGTVEGPVPGLPAWPDAGTAEVSAVAGAHPLQGGASLAVYYQGGGAFVPRDLAEVVPLLRYPDGSLAALALEVGAGRAVLSGVHLEITAPADGAGALTVDANRALLEAILRWVSQR